MDPDVLDLVKLRAERDAAVAARRAAFAAMERAQIAYAEALNRSNALEHLAEMAEAYLHRPAAATVITISAAEGDPAHVSPAC